MKYLILPILLSFLFCSNDSNIAGGTSTETTNGIVVLSNAGMPAINAVALIIDKSNWYNTTILGESPIIDTFYSDINGFIAIPESLSSKGVLINYGDETTLLSRMSDTTTLKAGHRLTGSAKGNSKIHLGGSPFTTIAQDNDSFHIDNVPEGTYSLFTETSNELSLFSRINFKQNESIQVVENDTSLLFDDFLGGLSGNPLDMVTKGVSWYLISNNINKLFVNGDWKESEGIEDTGQSTINATEYFGSVRFDINFQSSTVGSYAGVRANLEGTSESGGYDLTSMSGFKLKINGTGTIVISFKSALIDSLNKSLQDTIPHYQVSLNLNEKPIDTTFMVNNFQMDPINQLDKNNYLWSDCSKNIIAIEFKYSAAENQVNTDYWFELDEIRFDGVKLPL